ncbi:MAG TPA: ABC transporter permease [Candidatus Cloacimonetes bacterium]|nr:ABC transporter permease [Candidatus Cloacimonadota bacterium]HEX37742.1 ABC transporter permease [Candidatus Cloacimonadota bacterium]
MDFQKFFLRKFFSFKEKRDFFSFNSIISVIGIAVGVIALTVSLALFSGYQDVMKEVIMGVNSHIYILKFGSETLSVDEYEHISQGLDTLETIEAYAPFIYTEGMAVYGKKIAGVIIRGVDYQKEVETSKLDRFIKEGKFEPDEQSAVIGENVAKRLQVSIGDTIKLITPMNSDVTLAGMIPSSVKVQVTGIFSSGMYEFDNTLVFLPIDVTQEFLSIPGEYSGISVKLFNDFAEKAIEIDTQIQQELSYPYNVSNWIDLNKNLFGLLELEKWVIFIIIALIVLVAGFGLTSVLTMHIYDKQKEIGILKALGATEKMLRKVFFLRNLIIGFTGIILGLIIGQIISLVLTHTDIIKIQSDVYLIDHLVVVNEPIDYLFIVLVAGLIILFSSYVPLRKIAELDAVSIIRISKK